MPFKTDFENAKISKYDTDVFKPIFDELTKLSGKTYQSTLPKANEQGMAMLSDRGRFVLFAAAHPEPEFTFKPNEMHHSGMKCNSILHKSRAML